MAIRYLQDIVYRIIYDISQNVNNTSRLSTAMTTKTNGIQVTTIKELHFSLGFQLLLV